MAESQRDFSPFLQLEGGRASRSVLLLVALLMICGGGCGDHGVEFRSPRFVSAPGTHLIECFDSAAVWHETSKIEFGSPEARCHFVSGWGQDEESGGVWALGGHSSLEFFLRVPKAIRLKLDYWIPPRDFMPEQGMVVNVNGVELARIDFRSKTSARWNVEVPESLLRVGINRLDFHYDHVVRPCDLDGESRDARPLAVLWHGIDFKGLQTVAPPTRDQAPGSAAVTIPLGAQVGFFENLPAGTQLSIAGFDSWIGSGVVPGLEILVETDGRPMTRFMVEPDNSLKSLTFPLPESRSPWTKITFRPSVEGSRFHGRGGLRLIDPVLIMPTGFGPPEDVGSKAGRGHSDELELAEGTNIIIYLIDCLRADHVGAYGYDRPITPNIDLFASDSVVFENAFAQSSWTRPSVASLMTGMPPRVHGVLADLDVLPEDLPYLPQILQEAGYETASVITNGMVSQKFGFGRGYSYFERLAEQHRRSPEIHQQSDRLNEVIFDFLNRRSGVKPLFLYAHSTDPHAPYLPRKVYLERFASEVENPEIGRHDRVEDLDILSPREAEGLQGQLMDLYDAEIAFNDANFGRFLKALKDRGLYDSSVIVLVADHGEQFFEHGRWQHGFDLYQEVLHIPLIVRFPFGRWAGKRVPEAVQHVDLLPSLVDFVGLPEPQGIRGRSFLPILVGSDGVRDEQASFAWLARQPESRLLRSIILGSMKLILNEVADRPKDVMELYDLDEDPLENDNLADRQPIAAGYLRALIDREDVSSAENEGVEEAVLDEDLEDNLRALGYLQ